MTHHVLLLVSSSSKRQWATNKQTSSTVGCPCLQEEKKTLPVICCVSPMMSFVSVACRFNQPVPWARSAAPTGWTPVSWCTPVSPAGFWFHSAPRLHHCWPRTWPASEGTSPSCAPGKQKSWNCRVAFFCWCLLLWVQQLSKVTAVGFTIVSSNKLV